jgi:TonB family protein
MQFLTAITMQATLVLLAAFALSVLLRRTSAASRHLLWTLALAALLALPLLSLLGPRVPVIAHPVAVLVQEITVTAQSAPAPQPRAPIVLYVWMAGALAVLVRLLAGILRVAILSRNATSIAMGGFETGPYKNQLGIRRPVAILRSDRITIPLTWGVLRPVILLPAGVENWTPDRMRIVLAHELAHVKRRDCLTQVLAQIACAVYWFHPLVWVAVARLRREREQACDNRVLALGNRASDYAGHLVELARSLHSVNGRWAPAVAMAEPRELENRIAALLDPGRRRGTVTRTRAVLCAIAAGLLLLPLATLRAPAQARTALAGSVYDASGAAIPRANITLSNLDTGSRDTLTSSEDGSYAFIGIPAGRYALEVRKAGFKLFAQRDITVANTPARLDPTLEIGGVSESVDVIGQNRRPPASLPAPTRIRIGGMVQATKLISQVKPVYPEALQQQGIEGIILLQAIIAKDGALSALTVMNALANPELSKAALEAVKQWRYEPMLLNGEPVEVATTITVNFKLR